MSESESVVVTDVVSELVSGADDEPLDVSEVLDDETELVSSVSSDEFRDALVIERLCVDDVSLPLVKESSSLSRFSSESCWIVVADVAYNLANNELTLANPAPIVL